MAEAVPKSNCAPDAEVVKWLLYNVRLHSGQTLVYRKDIGHRLPGFTQELSKQFANATLKTIPKFSDKIQRKRSNGEYKYHNVSILEVTPALKINEDFFSTITITAEVKSAKLHENGTWKLLLSSSDTGFKVLIINTESRTVSLMVKEKARHALPFNLDNSFTNPEHLQLIINAVCNLRECNKQCSSVCELVSLDPTCSKCSRYEAQQRFQVKKVHYTHAQSQLLVQFDAISPDFGEYIRQQLKRGGLPPNASYDDETMSTMLRLFIKSPNAYKNLRESKIIGVVPAESTLIKHKNQIKQSPGINIDLLAWLRGEANKRGLAGVGGGLAVDEMSIQKKLEVVYDGSGSGLHEFIGYEELDPVITNLRDEKDSVLAQHVLQFYFNGYGGFGFPVCHYPVKTYTAEELNHLIQDVIYHLHGYNFNVEYVNLNGAAVNRKVIEINTTHPIRSYAYTSRNMNDRKATISWLMDPKHCVKNLRNSLYGSRLVGTKSKIKSRNGYLVWDHYLDLYRWSNETEVSISSRLTNEHLFPTTSLKLKNDLAEAMLDKDMLNSFKMYRRTLSDPTKVDGLIELLEVTCDLIEVFNDQKPVSSFGDPRMKSVQRALDYFKPFLDAKGYESFTAECTWDVVNCLTAILELTRRVTSKKGTLIIGLINSDAIKNHFCNVRTLHNGANRDLTYKTYCYIQNSVLLTQPVSLSKKRNAHVKFLTF